MIFWFASNSRVFRFSSVGTFGSKRLIIPFSCWDWEVILSPMLLTPPIIRVRIDSQRLRHWRRGFSRCQNVLTRSFSQIFHILRVVAGHGWVICYIYIGLSHTTHNFHANSEIGYVGILLFLAEKTTALIFLQGLKFCSLFYWFWNSLFC